MKANDHAEPREKLAELNEESPEEPDNQVEAYAPVSAGSEIVTILRRPMVAGIAPTLSWCSRRAQARYRRIRIVRGPPMAEPKQGCPDCGVPPGSMHQHECDIEQCPNCGRQLLTCGCSDSQRACRLPWTGQYPGIAECREFGWYARMVPGVGWSPCDADEPGATEDLNRFAMDAEWDPLEMRYIRKR
jgi:hypothetical protein